MRPPTKLAPAPLAVVAVLALAGCGSSASSTGSAGGSPQSTGGGSTTTVTTTSSQASTSGGTSTGPTADSTSGSSGTAAGVAACRTRSLHLSLISGQGAAGTAYITFGLTNAGSTSCTMIGYPGVAVLDGSGRIVQHPARRGTAGPVVPVRPVTLPPGVRAKFLVNSTDVIPSPGCPHSYTGATLQVFPPNQRAALRIPYTNSFCNLRVGPVQTGG